MAESTYAIIKVGGKQYRVEKGQSVLVDRVPEDVGVKVAPEALLYRGDRQTVFDGADLDKVRVDAVVAEHLRGKKVRVFKYRAKKRYRKRAGHRSELTRLEIKDIRLLSHKPAAKAAPSKEAAAEAKPTEVKVKPKDEEARKVVAAGKHEVAKKAKEAKKAKKAKKAESAKEAAPAGKAEVAEKAKEAEADKKAGSGAKKAKAEAKPKKTKAAKSGAARKASGEAKPDKEKAGESKGEAKPAGGVSE